MLNTLKPHYITIQPIGKNGAIYNKNNIIKSLPITSLNDENGYEMMDHIFYINSVKELALYESLFEFANMVYYMSEEYFEDIDEPFDKIFVLFKDSETDKQLFGLTIWEENGELDFTVVNLFEDEECNCNGDCEHCQYNEKDDEEFIIPKYFFGFTLCE